MPKTTHLPFAESQADDLSSRAADSMLGHNPNGTCISRMTTSTWWETLTSRSVSSPGKRAYCSGVIHSGRAAGLGLRTMWSRVPSGWSLRKSVMRDPFCSNNKSYHFLTEVAGGCVMRIRECLDTQHAYEIQLESVAARPQ
jgi:hypothetical protein